LNELKGALKIDEKFAILQKLIKEEQRVSVSGLSEFLGVSEVTVRRYLSKLEREGFVKRVRGGAILSETLDPAVTFATWLIHSKEDQEWKSKIGKVASTLIKRGSTIILDAGTTILEVARSMRKQVLSEVKVVTNNIPAVLELSNLSNITMIIIGGDVRVPSLSTVGPKSVSFLDGLNVDLLFLSVQGVSIEKGLTNTSLSDLPLKKAMISAAKEVVLVADSSKFGRVEFCNVAPISAVHKIVTDGRLLTSTRKEVEALGIELLLA